MTLKRFIITLIILLLVPIIAITNIGCASSPATITVTTTPPAITETVTITPTEQIEVTVTATVISQIPPTTIQGTPQFYKDEVMAIVQQRLKEQIIYSVGSIRITEISYVGNGKWSGTIRYLYYPRANEPGIDSSSKWNFYEKTQTVEFYK